MTHTAKLCNRACLEIKWKMASFFLVGVKTPIHLFTYSPFPFILPFDNFRRVEPKRRCSHHIHQNWAYATKRRLASLLLQFLAWIILQNYKIWRVWKSNEKWPAFSLVVLKTTIHLFTYSLSGNKIKKWTTFSCSELKQLFTYSPIHLFAYFRGVLGVLNQKGAEACMAARIGRMRLKMRLASSLIQFYLTWREHSVRTHYPYLLN